MKDSNVQMDFIQGNGSGIMGSGTVAQRLLQSNFNVNSLRTQDVLRKDEWIQFDNVVVEVARKRLVAVGDLLSRGLRYGVSNPLGTTKVEWETTSDLGDAIISMNGLTQGQNDRIQYELNSVPLPIIHKDFQINIRALEASRKLGQSLDTTQAALCARIVSEKIESLLFNGSNIVGTSNKIYGYTTEPNRNTGSTTADWNSASGDQIVGDVLEMIGKAMDDNMFGPYMLYVSVPAFVHMGDDYKDESDRTIMERVKAIPGIIDVKPSKDITNNGVVILVQLSPEVVDMIDGIQPTVVMWESHGGMLFNFKVMAIMAPRVKSDQTTQSGIVHYT